MDDVDDRGHFGHCWAEVMGHRYHDPQRSHEHPLVHNDRNLGGRAPHDRHDGPIYDSTVDGRGPRGSVQDANREARRGR